MKLFGKAKLRTRMVGVIVALAVINIAVAIGLLWHSYRTDTLFSSLFEEGMTGLVHAEELVAALVSQKGYASYYIIDRNPAWIDQIDRQAARFEGYLGNAVGEDTAAESHEILRQIGIEFEIYINCKNLMIDKYQTGEIGAGELLHQDVWSHFQHLLQLCNQYVETRHSQMDLAVTDFHIQVYRLRMMVLFAVVISAALAIGLVFFIQREVFQPIRKISIEAGHGQIPGDNRDDIAVLGEQVRGLVQHIDLSQAEIARSRLQLVKSEKLAVVGRLAAEVAHSIRGPMTSIGLRLYSLEQAGSFSEEQTEDLRVIRDDLNYQDNIIRNFLEFSRPPKLKRNVQSVSVILSQCLQLLEHTLERSNVEIVRKHSTLPLYCDVDGELLKEVFVNLVVNACEALTDGGQLYVQEYYVTEEEIGDAVVIEFRDTGPGLDETIADYLFEPFVTTKEEGTGLGLSISSRIVKEHGGRLTVASRPGEGTVFEVIIPTAKKYEADEWA